MEYTGSGKGRRGQQSGLIAPTVNDSLRIGLASPTMQTATTSPTVTTPGTDSTLHVGLASPALAGTTASSSGYGTYQYQKGKPNATVPDTTATDTTGTTGTTTVTGATDTTSRRQGRRGGGGGSAANNGGILSTNTATRTPTTRTTTSTTTATTKPEMFPTMQIAENQTIAGQLNALLSDDSKYIQNARMRAMETANERGLLNSSIAAGAGERAAIEAGLPIAQGDAQTYNNAATNATNAKYNYTLNEQNIAGNLKIANAKAKADAALQAANNAAALERLQAQSAADLAKVQEQAKINAEAEQPGRVDPVTGQYIPGGYKFEAEKALKQMGIDFDMAKLNADERQAFATKTGELYQQTMDAISKIQQQPDSSIPPDQKQEQIDGQLALLKASVGTQAKLYGQEVAWPPSNLGEGETWTAPEGTLGLPDVITDGTAADQSALTKIAMSEGFDEEAYLRANSDVAKKVADGTYESGLSHYLQKGRYENRTWDGKVTATDAPVVANSNLNLGGLLSKIL